MMLKGINIIFLKQLKSFVYNSKRKRVLDKFDYYSLKNFHHLVIETRAFLS